MKPIEIIQHLRQTNPVVLGKVPDPRAASILRAAFAEIFKSVRDPTSGVVQIPGLGGFVVSQVQREVDGEVHSIMGVTFVPIPEPMPPVAVAPQLVA